MTDPHAPDAAFDALVAALDPPMAVLTTAVAGQRSGCLVGFHSQAGIDPRRYAVWLSEPNHTAQLAQAEDCEWFALHLLGIDHHDLAVLFGAQTGDHVDKFSRCGWTEGPHGVPLLDECPDRIVGHRVSLTQVGADHLCLLLEPTSVSRGAGPPWLRLGAVTDVVAGHAPDDPPTHPDT